LINGVGYMVDLAVALAKLNSDVRILLIGKGVEFHKIKVRANACGVSNYNRMQDIKIFVNNFVN